MKAAMQFTKLNDFRTLKADYTLGSDLQIQPLVGVDGRKVHGSLWYRAGRYTEFA